MKTNMKSGGLLLLGQSIASNRTFLVGTRLSNDMNGKVRPVLRTSVVLSKRRYGVTDMTTYSSLPGSTLVLRRLSSTTW